MEIIINENTDLYAGFLSLKTCFETVGSKLTISMLNDLKLLTVKDKEVKKVIDFLNDELKISLKQVKINDHKWSIKKKAYIGIFTYILYTYLEARPENISRIVNRSISRCWEYKKFVKQLSPKITEEREILIAFEKIKSEFESK